LTPTIRGARRSAAIIIPLLVLTLACGGGGDDEADGGTDDAAIEDVQGESSDLLITAPSEGDPVAGGTLTYGLNAETSGWDASTAQWAGSGYLVAGAVYDRLMAYDEAGEVAPYLAESMTPNDDFTEWTIVTRPGVTFHDGTPFDAEALKKNLDTHKASFLTGATMRIVDSVSVVDERTVVVTLSAPWSTFPHLLTAQPGYMMSPASIDDGTANLEPVGTGPFEFVSWTQDNELVVERNDDYWRDGYPLLDRIEFRVITDFTAREQSLATGEVDMAELSNADQIVDATEQAEAGEVQIFLDREGENTETFIAFNTSQPPFDDPIARQAVAYAIDTESLSQSQFAGIFPAARGMFKENSPWYAETEYPTYDPDRARELVEQYEAEHGEPLRFKANITPQPEIAAIAQFLQSEAAAVGIDVELVTLDQTQLLLQALGGDYESTGFYLFGSEHPDREYVFLHEDNTEGEVALTFTRFADAELSAALDASRATDDLDEQIAQYQIVQDRLAAELPIVFLVHNQSGTVANNNVRDFKAWTLPDGEPGILNEGVINSLYQIWLQE
jgi:peptide/nickel transport system substrate-binding protein